LITLVFAHFSLVHLAHLFNFNISTLIWPGLFPATYVLHLVEEYWGGEGHAANLARTRGVTFSSLRFVLLTGLGLFLMVLGLVLAYRFDFPQTMLVILGTAFLLNGLSHVITSIANFSYNPGLISGVLLWMPLGAITLLQLMGSMTGARYLMAVGIGAGIQATALVVTFSGGQPIKARRELFLRAKRSAIETGEDG
jgi:hypothetical protein